MSAHTISKEEVQKLADLARLAITPEETAFFQKDIEAILGFIDTIQNVSVPEGQLKSEGFAPVGQVRADDLFVVPGSVTSEALIEAAPTHANNAVKVKKILQ